jgi:exonuclease III
MHTSLQQSDPGYSGVAIYSRVPPSRIENALGEDRFDDEGRFLLAQIRALNGGQCLLSKGQW